MIRVLVVAEETLFRIGVREILSRERAFLLSDCHPGRDLARTTTEFLPDIVLLGYELGDRMGLAVAREILSIRPEARVIIISHNTHDEESFAVIKRLASCLSITTEPATLSEVIKTVHRHWPSIEHTPLNGLDELTGHESETSHKVNEALSYREREVLAYISQGNTNKSVAQHLGISEQTVKCHVSSILRKLNAQDRAHAVALATHFQTYALNRIN